MATRNLDQASLSPTLPSFGHTNSFDQASLIQPCSHLQVVLYRWNVYNVFMLVPSAVIRALASRVLVLLEDGIAGDAPTNEGDPQEVRP